MKASNTRRRLCGGMRRRSQILPRPRCPTALHGTSPRLNLSEHPTMETMHSTRAPRCHASASFPQPRVDTSPERCDSSSNARSFVSTSQSGTRGFPSPEPSPTMPTPYTGSSYEHSHGANNRPYTHEHSSTPRPKPTVCIPAPSHERGLGSEGFGTPQSQPSSVYFTPMDRSAQSASASGYVRALC